jgi:hypothetical protein
MNERIKNLIDEASLNYVTGRKNTFYIKEDFCVFTELVVKECAGFIQDLVDQRIPASEYPDRLKQYFNVE